MLIFSDALLANFGLALLPAPSFLRALRINYSRSIRLVRMLRFSFLSDALWCASSFSSERSFVGLLLIEV